MSPEQEAAGDLEVEALLPRVRTYKKRALNRQLWAIEGFRHSQAVDDCHDGSNWFSS
jgi:hypothetical protein